MNKCPYCGGKVTPPNVKKFETPGHAHGLCTKCGKHPRAKVSWDKADKMFISYSREAHQRVFPADKKTILLQKWVSPNDLKLLESGEKVLTVEVGGLILLVYKSAV